MPDHCRKIIHIDMDAFFAAVEQRDFPKYRNKPLIVGGQPNSRGVVATCNYEARKFGIHSAMPSSQAYRLCPQAVFVKPRFEAYKQASVLIRQVFADYTNLFEPLSLDEAYLDVSSSTIHQGSATLIAKEIKQAIFAKTQLIASACISYNKFLAKIASDMDKPDGLYLITPEQGVQFVESMAIGKFHGIGKATEKKMRAYGIETGQDLKKQSLAFLLQTFGKAGQHYHNIARAIDHRPVNNHRESKSVGVETTYPIDIRKHQQVLDQLHYLLNKALKKLNDKKLTAQTVSIKIKYHDFVQITRSQTLSVSISQSMDFTSIFENLLKNTDVGQRNIRLLGVSLSSLHYSSETFKYQQMDLFDLVP
ncbi:MAG: DNA polymerase IV [Methylococcales symbiont of Hymedesmia sp. n. MRB-2018]|nr:MAG: DNA polymerase IV [Methylococcales symbiont of Hymedesmia sp. n. MRB-2018]